MSRRPASLRSARLLVAGLAATAGLASAGCRYYEVTRPDGSTERISQGEYEDMQRTADRLGNVPTMRSNPAGSPRDGSDR